MADKGSETVFCTYRVIQGKEEEILALIREHDAVLRRLGLAGDAPMTVYRGEDGKGRPFIVKFFDWRSAAALDAARKHPEVQMIWERLDALCEEREGLPNMEFPHVERVV